jgi:hypothetical protein
MDLQPNDAWIQQVRVTRVKYVRDLENESDDLIYKFVLNGWQSQ